MCRSFFQDSLSSSAVIRSGPEFPGYCLSFSLCFSEFLDIYRVFLENSPSSSFLGVVRNFSEFLRSFAEFLDVLYEVSEVITPMCMPHSCIGTHCARVLWNTAAFCHILNREYLEDMELSTKILKATHL